MRDDAMVRWGPYQGRDEFVAIVKDCKSTIHASECLMIHGRISTQCIGRSRWDWPADVITDSDEFVG
jgi:hypothetical protein